MRQESSTYKQIIASGNTRIFHVRVIMTLVDDTQLTITDEHIMQGSFKLEMASSGTSSFDLGSAVIGMCRFSLDNFDDTFTGYDFFNATASVWIKLEGDSDFERIGIYTVDEPVFAGAIVSIEMLDNMWKFDRPLSETNISFPCDAQTAVNAICQYCGVTLATQTFHGYQFDLTVSPKQEITCRELLQYVAMITCNFCIMNSSGSLVLRWYDVSARPEDSLDGGTFNTNTTPYSDGDTADGGNFTNYYSGDDYDGGDFIDDENVDWFTKNFSANIGTDEISITGVKFTIDNVDYSIGTDGYVLTLENPLVDASNVSDVLNLIWEVLADFRLRTFNITTLPDISAEVGDCCAVMDAKGNIVYTWITLISFGLSSQTVQCNAVTPTRKLTTRYSKAVQTAVEVAKKNIDTEITRYDVAVQIMNDLAINAMGAYQDYEDLQTGGRVYYLSNKPITKENNVCTFVDGSTVFKASGDGFFVSTEVVSGVPTNWKNGYDPVSGTLLVNVLKAIGVSADWVETGLLRDKDNYNYWDLDHNIFHLSGGTSVGSGGTTLNDLALKDATIADVDVEYAKNQSSSTAPTTGWSTSSPQWEVGYYIWQRTKTTDGEGTVSYSTPVCIQGAKGQDGNSISSVTITYGTSSSPSTMPSTWQTTIPSVSEGDFLWTRTIIDYTDTSVQDTVSYTYSRQGEDGQQGQAGTSVTVSSIKYQAGTSSTTAPTGTWSDTVVTVPQGQYLWTKTTFSNGSIAYGVARQGEDGDEGTGVSAIVEQYYLSTSNQSPTGGSWSETQPQWVSGKYIWTRSKVTWTDTTITYTDPVLAQAINQANQSVATLDSSLDQTGVYNRLTNYSQNEGIYLQNGHLYVNATMINTGDLSANRIKGGTLILGGTGTSWTKMNVEDNNGNYLGGIADAWYANELYVYGADNPNGWNEISILNGNDGWRTIGVPNINASRTWQYTYRPYVAGQMIDLYPNDLGYRIILEDGNGTEVYYYDVFGSSELKYRDNSSHTTPLSFAYCEAVDTAGEFGPAYTGTSGEIYEIPKNFGDEAGEYIMLTLTINNQQTLYNAGVRRIRIKFSYYGYIVGIRSDGIYGNHRGTFNGYANIYDSGANLFIDNANREIHIINTTTDRMDIAYDDITQTVSGTAKHPIWSASDERVKEDIEPLDVDLSLNLIDATKPKRFKFKNTDGIHYGVTAQDMREILDNIGETDSELEHSMGLPEEKTGLDDERMVDYLEFIPPLINYVKYLRAEIKKLEAQIKEGK